MKPVVSSIIALAIAILPATVLAKPHHKHAKAAKVVKVEENKDKKPIVKVKAVKKDGAAKAHSAVHHAHNVDVSGAGHKEPKDPGATGNGAIVPASMTTKAAKPHAAKGKDLPKLPNPNAGKPSKGGAEKGAARKPAEKKADSSDANDGEPTRDEEIADLVARIRGRHDASSSSEDPSSTKKNGDDDDDARDVKAKGASHISTKPTQPAPTCTKEPIEIVRGPEMDRFALTKCDGTVAPLAVEHLSILIRPGSAARPTMPIDELAKKPGPELAHGIRRVDPRLALRLQSVADHFASKGAPAKLFVISGYRPTSVGSMHSTGRAIDFRVEGAKNEDVVAFCKTLDDTGCGFYPNSSFVHLDVRDQGRGHVSWIDASGPGQKPHYVSSWPPPSPLHRTGMSDLAEEGANLLRAQRPADENQVEAHPSEAGPPPIE